MPRDTFFLEFDSPSKDLFPTVCIQQVWITNHKQYWTNESWTAVESVPVRLRNATQFLSENSRYPGQEPSTWCSGVSWHKCRLECRLFSSRCFLRPFQAMKVTSSFFFIVLSLTRRHRLNQFSGTVLLQKPTFPQLVRKLTPFYETLSFITAFTRAHHWSLSWARPVHSSFPIPFLEYPL